MHAIRLSICIPTHNFGAFIGETLSAVIDQFRGRKDVEIVVLDGGSTDNTEEVVRSFLARLTSLTYHRLERRGGIDNDLARTMELAQGDYCWLLSSDDLPVAGAIPRMIRELESGCDIYLCSRTVCDHNLRPLFDQQWLNGNVEDRTFTFTGPRDFISYFSGAQSIGALFSYISSIVVRRERWNAVVPDKKVIGTHYAHALRLFSILLQGGTLRYLREPLVICRGGNDSFAKHGVAHRFLIDLDGYLFLADTLFSGADVRQAFLAVMRREHPWYVYAELRNRISDREQWCNFQTKLLEFGYEPWKIAVVGVLGALPPVTIVARFLWFGMRDVRRFIARLVQRRKGA